MKTSIGILGVWIAASAAGIGCGKRANVEPSPASKSGDLAGSYTIASSSNPGTAVGYKGTVAIAKNGATYKLDWAVTNAPPYHGVAIPTGDTLAVGWGEGTEYGVAVYKVAGGTLTGTWATASSAGAIGTEVIEGSPGVSGTYKITRATMPGGKSYGGNVTIAPRGDARSVEWKLADGSSYSGTGILDGDMLIVGWGEEGKGAGVVDYKVSDGTLTGRWGVPGVATLGTETLKK
jgi:hypothetical protein